MRVYDFSIPRVGREKEREGFYMVPEIIATVKLLTLMQPPISSAERKYIYEK